MLKITKAFVTDNCSPKNPPVARCQSGETVIFETRDCYDDRLQGDGTVIEPEKALENPATGPLYVEGAEPGDVLKVHIDKITINPTGLMRCSTSAGAFNDLVEYRKVRQFDTTGEYIQFTDKLKLNVETVKSNKHADFGSMTRPFNDSERAIMQAHINRGYATFIKRCADGRQMSTADIEAVAQGRVWTGEMAKDLGLVDLLGDIEMAKEIAAEKAGIESYTLISYPEEESTLTMLLDQTKESYIEARMGKMVGQFKNELNLIYNLENMNNLQARMPYEIHLMN